jgi:hypothetical protein
MSINLKDVPIFGEAHAKQTNFNSRTFYSFSQHASKGETYHYESFKEIFDKQIAIRTALLENYQKSFPVCNQEHLKKSQYENWHFLFGVNFSHGPAKIPQEQLGRL